MTDTSFYRTDQNRRTFLAGVSSAALADLGFWASPATAHHGWGI